MTTKQFVALCVRLAGFFILINALVILPHALRMLLGQGQLPAGDGWWLVSVEAIWLVAAICMIAFPLTVAGNWLADHGDQPLSFQWTRNEVESAAFTILGLYFSLHAIRELVYWLSSWIHLYFFYQAGRLDGWPEGVSLNGSINFPALLAAVVELVIGVWLLFGAKGLRKLLRMARDGGASSVDVATPEP